MHPTPAILAAAYEFIKTVPPVPEWKLPPAEEVEFRVTRDKTKYGQHSTYRWTKEHIIYLSSARVSHGDTLLQILAHEMVHAAMAKAGNDPVSHNRAFWERAVPLCINMGWDHKAF